MFTGLIRAIGTLKSFAANSCQILCNSPEILQDLALGDSVAVDGICLTVTDVLPTGFTADISPETLDRTTLGKAEGQPYVNLELSLRVGSKLGGHFVTGHIDGVGYLEGSVQTATAWEMSFQVPDRRVARYIVPKGSIAVSGISLTVADCNPQGSWFKVAVIPLTYAETNLRYLQPGDLVNLEGDILGKYAEKFLRLGTRADQAPVTDWETMQEDVTPAFLAENGYVGL
jgi:riboflavin synthase